MIKRLIYSEILWNLMAIAIAALVLIPPYVSIGSFKFLFENAFIIFSCVFIIRLLFFHNDAIWLNSKLAKFFLIVLLIPLIAFTISTLNGIQNYVDAYSFQDLFLEPSNVDAAITWGKYLRNETFFFGSGLLISALLLPIVLLIGVWRDVKSANRT